MGDRHGRSHCSTLFSHCHHYVCVFNCQQYLAQASSPPQQLSTAHKWLGKKRVSLTWRKLLVEIHNQMKLILWMTLEIGKTTHRSKLQLICSDENQSLYLFVIKWCLVAILEYHSIKSMLFLFKQILL